MVPIPAMESRSHTPSWYTPRLFSAGETVSWSCCCPRRDLSRFGIEPRGCLDAATLRILDIPYDSARSDLREGCLCVRSVDIGEYGTCGHGCVYCYAGGDGGIRRLYSDDTELLWGAVMPRDRVVDLRGRDAERLDRYT